MSNVVAQKPKFSVAIQTDGYKKLINNTLQDPKRAQRFIASISSAVAVNPALQECDAGTILSCALLGESLELSPSPQLGQYYLVPFDVTVKGENGKAIKDEYGNYQKRKVATFKLGYKGYIQLAIRSGQYKKLNVLAIKKGELIRYDPLNEEIEVNLMQDELQREISETIGYYAMFEYINGFRKTLYWSKEKMIQHADKYSAAYSSASHTKLLAGQIPEKDQWKYSSFWYKDFDGMAYKTMLRQLISKWGMLSTSIQMQQALENDDSVINQDGTVDYIGGEDIPQISSEIETAIDEAIEQETGEIYEEQQEISMSDLA